MPKQPRTEYVVEGSYPFPFDMLRREFAFPARTEDAMAMALVAEPEPQTRPHPRNGLALKTERGAITARVTLVTSALWPWQLNPDRWESMGWRIVEGAE